jgi:DNA-binding CsgD family transcriptional regulator
MAVSLFRTPLDDGLGGGARGLMDDCTAAQSLSAMHQILEKFVTYAGAENFFLLIVFSQSNLRRRTVILQNWQQDWMKNYRTKKLYRIDPVFEYCRNYSKPLAWKQLRLCKELTSEHRTFLDEAEAFGICDGASFPLHGGTKEWGFLTISASQPMGRPEAIDDPLLSVGKLLSSCLQDAARRIVMSRRTICEASALTRRERQCLLWSAEGKTSWETAKILNIAERTVVYHLQNAMEKLGATNRIQAVTRAITDLICDPDTVYGALSQCVAPMPIVTMDCDVT